ASLNIVRPPVRNGRAERPLAVGSNPRGDRKVERLSGRQRSVPAQRAGDDLDAARWKNLDDHVHSALGRLEVKDKGKRLSEGNRCRRSLPAAYDCRLNLVGSGDLKQHHEGGNSKNRTPSWTHDMPRP